MELWHAYLDSEFGPLITAIISLCSAACALLSSRSKSPILQGILDLVSVGALAIGKAKMKDDDR
tara:strand:- start:275 stop:466 length:192 start_codon:yes stop_codon:yes gene_type:complete